MKDLSGKTAYDLELEDFEKLFCQCCRDSEVCDKDPKTVNMCLGLIDSGLWDSHLRKCQD